MASKESSGFQGELLEESWPTQLKIGEPGTQRGCLASSLPFPFMSQTDSPKSPNYASVCANNCSNISICSLRKTKQRSSFPTVDPFSFCQFLEREKRRVTQCYGLRAKCPHGLLGLNTESPAGGTILESCKTLKR